MSYYVALFFKDIVYANKGARLLHVRPSDSRSHVQRYRENNAVLWRYRSQEEMEIMQVSELKETQQSAAGV